MQGLKDLDVRGRRVLVRVDFNVPLKNGRVADATRIEAALPTIRYLLERGGRPILMSHLGRPKGERDPAYSLAPCLPVLERALHCPVHFASDCVGPEAERLAATLKPGEVLLLENLRFHPGEERPESEPDFIEQLANLGDCYVDDAFGTAHRAHASVTGVVPYFPGRAAAGFLLEKEIAFLGEALLRPKRPFYAIIGGAKVSSKLGVLKALVAKADKVFIGGGMAYTFLKGQGLSVGRSLIEEELIPTTREIMGPKIILPTDVIVAKEISEEATTSVVKLADGIPEDLEGLDVGPETIKAWAKELQDAQTLFWNGPLGVFEVAPFSSGTFAMAKILADSEAITIVGGGDSIAAINKSGVASQIDHISTGGGAALEYIEFGTLPGLDALNR
ncbi:MAG: phosphoglycerate kinase [Parachlamydiales bacterium]